MRKLPSPKPSRWPMTFLYQGVKGVTDLMVRPGLINLDFADVRAVMDEMGKAMMGTGEADGRRSRDPGGGKSYRQPAAGRNQPAWRAWCADQHHWRRRSYPVSNWTKRPTASAKRLIQKQISSLAPPWTPIWAVRMRVSVVATGIDASEVVMETLQSRAANCPSL